uniref:Uncharacterized protein n=1 Tax=Arundo donax TaxID=35708 RepID=A0A0A9G579_ARUDO
MRIGYVNIVSCPCMRLRLSNINDCVSLNVPRRCTPFLLHDNVLIPKLSVH